MPFGRMYEWIDPFKELEEMERYLRDREDEDRDRLHWALAEVGRHRSVVDTAFHEALNKYVPQMALDRPTATTIMDSAIAGRMIRR